ncbi:amidophosphoribosyltransferase [Patescibacteria group bacterium]|nr:amidophosphoribosyltransferase [Patescibacteria group bacterium]
MCGIIGIIGNQDVAVEIYEGLICLQHRGQDSAGIATYNKQFHLKKGMGLVRDIFRQDHMENLRGNLGLGHVRYPTVGVKSAEDAQPFIVNSPYGIAMAHNGNVFNFDKLKHELFEENFRHINSNCDVEVILNVFAYELQRFCHRDFFDSVCQAVSGVYKRVKGAYAVVAIIADKGLIAFRDPYGIKPLVWGRRQSSFKTEHLFTSENTMFQILDFEFFRDVGPGEVVYVDLNGEVKSKEVLKKNFTPCIFEYVYFARPDSFLNNVSVYRSRLRMGQNLAKKIKKQYPDLEIDAVVPAPESSTPAAMSLAKELGVRFTMGLIKNHTIGRTFIMPGQDIRKRANEFKLSPIEIEIRDKNILVVDDSIVRGNVSRHIVKLMRGAGAKKVYFSSTAPPLRWPCLYGIDLPTREEYIAYNLNEEEIAKSIGADLVIYQDQEDLIEAVVRKGDVKFKQPCAACFDGQYPTGDINEEVLRDIEIQRKADRKIIEGKGSVMF